MMDIQNRSINPSDNSPDLIDLVAGHWPAALRDWFCRLMRGEQQQPPEIGLDAWRKWLRSIEEHGLSSLLFSCLRTYDKSAWPPTEIFAALRATYYEEVARIMVRRTQLNNLLKWFGEAGIEPLVLKGAALGETVYSDVFQRPTADIDILVPKEALEIARAVLLKNGYRSKRGDRRMLMGWTCDEEFLPAAGEEDHQFVVELHWSLTSHAQLVDSIETGVIFGRSERGDLLDRPFLALNPVDALVYACLHLFYKHINELRLIWLYDIHLLAQRIESLGLWSEVVSLSQQWQARLALVNCLQLARNWFGTPFPDELSDRSYKPASLDEMQLFNLAIFQLGHGQRSGWLKKHLFQIRRLKGWDKFLYIKSRLFPTRQEIEANYPRLRPWPGPLLHIGRLAMMFMAKRG